MLDEDVEQKALSLLVGSKGSLKDSLAISTKLNVLIMLFNNCPLSI